MEIMQKYAKDDGAFGIENLDRWPSASDAVGLLSTTTSATSVHELLKVSITSPFESHDLTSLASAAQTSLEKEDLKWIVGLAAVAANRGFNYQERTEAPSR